MEWNLPGADSPGFLRRRRELAVLLDGAPSPENVDALANYLVQFVKEPVDRAEALEAILDAPSREYQGVVMRLMGYNVAPVPPPLGGPSGGP